MNQVKRPFRVATGWLYAPVLAALCCLDLCGANALPDQPAVPASSPLPPHPRLLLDAQGIAELKQRIAATGWAKASWAELKATADKALGAPLALPPRGGNWSHNYVCPTHGARLTTGKQVGPWQWEHICPVGHHVLRGDPSRASLDFDGNTIASAHANYAHQVVQAGLLYQVTGDLRYARRAREVLLAYADRYLGYPLHDNQGKPGKGGHVASQSLTEASWLIDMALGADLVWTTLTEADRHTLESKLFRPALEQVVLRSRLGIHNIQCRHNSAIGLVGYLLGDQKLIATAIDDPVRGFRQQLQKGVQADGMWCEGASGYHFFTIEGLWQLAEAARHCGLNLYDAAFERMFSGPLNLAMPNLVLPNFNDSGTVPLQGQADLYELAYARYHQPAYLPLLAASSRRGMMALLFGATSLPPAGPSALSASRNSSASGYAILQQGSGPEATWLCVKYGPHGGGHGHPDKNTFILYSRGQILALDAGTHAYGSKLHTTWDKTTLAHNTLVVDQQSQEPATGQCLAFGSEHGVDYVITGAGSIYPDVAFTRTAALLTPQLVVFVDQIRAAAPHTFDLAYHQVGQWETNQATRDTACTPWSPPALPGYKCLTQAAQRALPGDGLVLNTSVSSDWHPSLILAPGPATEVITAYGVAKTTEDLAPVLLQRRQARETAFLWAVSLDGSPVSLSGSNVKDSTGKPLAQSEAVAVQVAAGNHSWSLLVNPSKRAVIDPADSAARSTEAAFKVH